MTDTISLEDIKNLCWIAWRMGSIGSDDSIHADLSAFTEWWEKSGLFLIENPPVPFQELPDEA